MKRFFLPISIGLAIVAGYGLHAFMNGDCLSQRYPHINHYYRCSSTGQRLPFSPSYEEFEGQLSDWIHQRTMAGDVSEASIYFRDLSTGPWFGIRERDPYIPASLFKVPVMLAVLKLSETQSDFLQQKATLSGSYTGLNNVEHEDETITPGKEYTVSELLEKMIVYSDNASSDLLRSILSANGIVIEDVSQELGILSTKNEGQLSAKSYAALFRILYNAQYVSPEKSEFALSLLSRTAFRQGIRAGVPETIQVAHKFGIHDIDGDEQKQFHDCGIVYHPLRPYILCVLTKSTNVQLASRFMRDVSEKVFDRVNNNSTDTTEQ